MIKSYWLRILLCGLGAAIVGFVIALVTPKQYDGFFQIMVAAIFAEYSSSWNRSRRIG